MSNCSSISLCGRISVQVDCLTNIYQGEDAEITFQFLNIEKEALDLYQYDTITGVVYNELDIKIASYEYPSSSTSYELSIYDNGISKIIIPSNITSNTISGRIFIEFKLTEVDTIYNNGVKTTIIPCIMIAILKPSYTNSYTQLSSISIDPSILIEKDNKIKELEELIKNYQAEIEELKNNNNG